MSIDISTQQRFAEEMAEYIFSRTAGSHKKDETTEMKPSRKFFLGNLAAARPNPEYQTDDDEEGRSSIRAQRLETSILVDEKDIKDENILIEVSGHFYYKVEDEDDGKKFWKKKNFFDSWETKIAPSSKDIDFSEALEEANKDEKIVKKIKEDTFEAVLYISIEDFQDEGKLVTFKLVNEGEEELEKRDPFDRSLYDCHLTVDLKGIDNIEFQEEYMYEGHPQRYYYDFRTVNCHAKWVDGKKFTTQHFGEFYQRNIQPRENLQKINFTFSNLSNKKGLEDINKFLDLMEKRLETYEANVKNKEGENWKKKVGKREKKWQEQIEKVQHFEKLLSRVKEGIKILQNNEKALKSFLWMNETFDEYFSNYHEIKDGEWRIFQLVFILTTIESITDEKNLNLADVVHVPTGGGKTEAYLGLVLFTLFYERLVGKDGGVSAIVKFPLRMLSVQQLERISSIIVYANEIRSKKTEIENTNNFSIGYFVGSRNPDFPAFYKDLKNRLYDEERDEFVEKQSFVLPKCPFCSSDVYLKNDDNHKRILHYCRDCKKEYEIYLSDREIYRWRPSFLVSTVDKWAAVSMQRRMRNLLGGNGSYCPEGHGFIPSGDVCENNDRNEEFTCGKKGKDKESYDGPRLSIQDEMHLLREGFGSISGHFEGIIEEIIKSTSDRGLKHIALSATLRGTKSQVKELYKKEAFVLPGNCPEGKGDDFDLFYKKIEGPKRIIYGVKPNLRDNHYASLRTLLHQIEFILDQQKLLDKKPNEFEKKYSITKEKAQELLNYYFISLTYHLKKQDAYDMNRLKSAVVNDRLEKKSNIKMKGDVVTGDCSLYELRDIIGRVEEYFEQNSISNITSESEKCYSDPLYATSVVSHGVDLDQLNFMVFQGLPYSTSEYIQALSRVGRKNLGEIIVWFYPNRVRDDSFYRNFKRYHDSLDHEVRPIPIKRDARLATKQTITSLFCGGILNYLSNKKGRPLYQKGAIEKLGDEDWMDLVNFIERVYGRQLEIDLSNEVQARKDQIIKDEDYNDNWFFPQILTESEERYYKTQTGMRGIQKSFLLELDDPNENFARRWIGE